MRPPNCSERLRCTAGDPPKVRRGAGLELLLPPRSPLPGAELPRQPSRPLDIAKDPGDRLLPYATLAAPTAPRGLRFWLGLEEFHGHPAGWSAPPGLGLQSFQAEDGGVQVHQFPTQLFQYLGDR